MPMNERQVKLFNRLLDGFEGEPTTSKWVAIAKCSPDTALRDINELLAHCANPLLAGALTPTS
jgi:Fic family protein